MECITTSYISNLLVFNSSLSDHTCFNIARPKATSIGAIGALSYIAVQCYEHIVSRQSPYRFRLMECASTRTQRFNLLPSSHFFAWFY